MATIRKLTAEEVAAIMPETADYQLIQAVASWQVGDVIELDNPQNKGNGHIYHNDVFIAARARGLALHRMKIVGSNRLIYEVREAGKKPGPKGRR